MYNLILTICTRGISNGKPEKITTAYILTFPTLPHVFQRLDLSPIPRQSRPCINIYIHTYMDVKYIRVSGTARIYISYILYCYIEMEGRP